MIYEIHFSSKKITIASILWLVLSSFMLFLATICLLSELTFAYVLWFSSMLLLVLVSLGFLIFSYRIGKPIMLTADDKKIVRYSLFGKKMRVISWNDVESIDKIHAPTGYGVSADFIFIKVTKQKPIYLNRWQMIEDYEDAIKVLNDQLHKYFYQC